MGALIISFLIGEKIDAVVIATILVINAVIGFLQEFKAEKDTEALRKLSSLRAVAVREAVEQEIDSSEVVPGDILLIREGDKVSGPVDRYPNPPREPRY